MTARTMMRKHDQLIQEFLRDVYAAGVVHAAPFETDEQPIGGFILLVQADELEAMSEKYADGYQGLRVQVREAGPTDAY